MNYLQKKKLAFMSIVNRVKGFVRTVTGVLPLTLTNCVDDDSIIDYTLYGQSVQDGTPTPETPVEVESVGEKTTNLINWDLLLSDTTITKVENGYYSNTYAHIFNSTSNIVKHLKSVLKPDVTYTLSRVCVPDLSVNGSAIGRISIKANSTELAVCVYWGGLKSVKFTLTQEQIDSITAIEIYFYTKGTTISELQLTESDTILPYEPYGYKIPIKVSGNSKTITTNIYLDEPLRKVGDYADYIDFENGKVVRCIKKTTFTGNEAFEVRSHYNNETTKFSLSNFLEQYAGVMCVSNIGSFENGTNANATGETGVGLWNGNTGTSRIVYLEVPYKYNTAESLSTYLSTNKVYVIYQLATPTQTPISLPTIPTFKGTSIISADTTTQPSNAEITYYSNVKE